MTYSDGRIYLDQNLTDGIPHPDLNDFQTAALLAQPETVIVPHHLPTPTSATTAGSHPRSY